jgi:hypothetical protein
MQYYNSKLTDTVCRIEAFELPKYGINIGLATKGTNEVSAMDVMNLYSEADLAKLKEEGLP